jgi:2-alkyl-3-oxoalkanoate reductase
MTMERPVVIVTGSSGLLGHPTCVKLAEAGYEVFGFDRVGLPEPPSHLEYVHDIECDVTDYSSVRGAVAEVKQARGNRIASVVHLAAFYDFSGEDSPMYKKVTIEGTDRLLNALRGMELEQFVFSSTMLVHEPTKPGMLIDESSPLVAKWAYPESKIATERLIREAHSDVNSVFLRISGVYTDWGTQPTLVQQIKRIYERDFESHFFPGDQSAGQSAIYLDDAVEAIIATVERRKSIAPTTPILIGEPEPPSYGELQDKIGQHLFGSDWSTVYVPPALAKVGARVIDALHGGESFIKPFMVDMADDHYALNVSRAKELLDWEPRHRINNKLHVILKNLLDQPELWYEKNSLGQAPSHARPGEVPHS